MAEAKITWKGGIKFEGISRFGVPIVLDGEKENGGEEAGYSPSQLVLFGLIGCTGIDIVMILKKMRQKLTALEIEAIATQPETYPKPFERIEIVYKVSGENLDEERVRHAVKLSEEKYCVVSHTLKRTTEITYRIEIS